MISLPQRTPDKLYYICLPEPGDLSNASIEESTNCTAFKRLGLSAKDFNQDYERIYSEKVYKGTQPSKAADIDPMLEDDAQVSMDLDPRLKILAPETLEVTTGVNMKRKLIGFVTYGGFSMHRGYGLGKGSIGKEFIQHLNVGDYVLVRSPSSTLYFKARIDKLY